MIIHDFQTHLIKPGSVYKDYSDYGQIYISELYTTFHQCDSNSSDQHDSFRQMIQDSFNAHLDSVVGLRKTIGTQKVDVNALKRKVQAISSCTKCMVNLLNDGKSAELFLIGKMTDRLLASDSTSILVLMVPLYEQLLASVVAICERYDRLTLIGIDLIKKYMLSPSPALQKLSKSKQEEYQKIKNHGLQAFKHLIVNFENGSQVEAQMANLTNRSVSMLNKNETLALSHLYEMMVDLLHISRNRLNSVYNILIM